MTKNTALQIVAPDRDRHGEELIDLVAKTFGNYCDHYPAMQQEMLNDPYYSFSATRIGIMDDKIVTHFGVFDYQMCVGSARLRTGGIGGVATHWLYRKKGLMDLTANAALECMRNAGFDFSVLFGIGNFYHRFGYSRAWSERELTIPLVDLPEPAPAKTITEFAFERRPDIERLFNRYYADITGAAVRPTYETWNRRRKQVGFSWNDARGRLTGYICLQDAGSQIDIFEAAGDSDKILAAVAFVARKFACDDVHFICLPHETPLAKTLRRGSCKERIVYNRNAGAMARLLHLPRTLTKLGGELSTRLADAGLSDYRGKLSITDGRDWVTLHLASGKIRAADGRDKTAHALHAGNAISQLILGTDDPAETIAAHNMKTTGDAAMLTRALFPNQYPTLPRNDRY